METMKGIGAGLVVVALLLLGYLIIRDAAAPPKACDVSSPNALACTTRDGTTVYR